MNEVVYVSLIPYEDLLKILGDRNRTIRLRLAAYDLWDVLHAFMEAQPYKVMPLHEVRKLGRCTGIASNTLSDLLGTNTNSTAAIVRVVEVI